MTDHSTPANITESIYSGKVLTAMASSVNEHHLKFSSWMVAGFGAAIGLLISNIDKVATYISPAAIGCSTKLFLVAVVLNVLQRYLGAIISGSMEVAKKVEDLPINGDLNTQAILKEIERATLWPTRYMVRSSNKRILSGDIAYGGRLNAWMAQIAGWLVLSQMVAVVSAAWIIANALKG